MNAYRLIEALEEEGWIIAMQEELNQFERNKNKARLVAPGFRQEEGIDYDETFTLVIRLEAIRIFLVYAAYMGFTVYQMDVKSAFSDGKILKEVYVQQPLRYQANPKESHIVVVKRIFKYLKGTSNLGLWYPKGSGFNLKAYSDSDYAGCNLDRKSTSGGYQILDGKLVCWSAKKQIFVAMSSAEANYVAVAGYYAQVLWIKKSSSQQQPKQLTPASNIYFECEDGHIAFNSSIILLETKIPLYKDLLQLFLNNCFSTAVTKQPSAYYLKYHREFWYMTKEMVMDALATLGLVDENDLELSSTNLVNSSPLRIRYFSTTWRVLMSYIVKCLVPKKSLILPSVEVNVDTIADKSSYGTATQHGAQPKAPTKKKSRRKKTPPSSKLKASNVVRKSTLKKQVADTRPTKETVATADTTQSLEASESAEELSNQTKPVEAEREVRGSRITSMGNISFKELCDQNKNKEANKEDYENPFDIKSKIKFIGKEVPMTTATPEVSKLHEIQAECAHKDQDIEEADSDLKSMPRDKIESLFGFEADETNDDDTQSKHKEEFSKADEAAVDNVIDELVDMAKLRMLISMLSLITTSVRPPCVMLIFTIKDLFILIDTTSTSSKAAPEGENMSTQANKDSNITFPTPAQGEQQPINTITKSTTTEEAKKEPPVKKLKFFMPDFTIPSPTPLNSIMPQGIKPPFIIDNIPFEKFLASLFSSSSFEFSLTPPSIVDDKEKGISIKEDLIKQLMPFIEQGGSTQKIPNLQQFSTSGEEKSKKRLKVLTPEELKAHASELASYEAKRAKILEEYNHCINFRADPLTVTKISYRVNNSTKEACMRITRNNKPLNLTMYDMFARKLGISPPPQLTAFELSALKKKRKRSSKLIKEVFVKEDIVMDGIHKKLVPPSRAVGFRWLVIREPESRIFFYNGNFDTPEGKEMYNKLEFIIETRNDVVEARKIIKDNLDNLDQQM
uniref:Retrovirus-related Pol polyprotein from transposon TNT 1-94 n=1 Tax=Tanacetum cinerariifolium TaxID=118510 RepID=A0A699GY98_TANCI|nr:retrovirus-related Pol polyprotein from transposon TNT 1-94 [Tanacetum cinerariifolium]